MERRIFLPRHSSLEFDPLGLHCPDPFRATRPETGRGNLLPVLLVTDVLGQRASSNVGRDKREESFTGEGRGKSAPQVGGGFFFIRITLLRLVLDCRNGCPVGGEFDFAGVLKPDLPVKPAAS